jgi:hypothetical protein
MFEIKLALFGSVVLAACACLDGGVRGEGAMAPRVRSVVALTLKEPAPARRSRGSTALGLAFDTRGRIIVTRPEGRIDIIAADGSPEFVVSNVPGGVFSNPCCATMGGDGRLWIIQRGINQYLGFKLSDDSASLDEIIPMPAAASGTLARVLWDRDGRIIHLSDHFAASTKGFSIVSRLLDSLGQVVSTETLAKSDSGMNVNDVVLAGRGGTTSVSQPFGPEVLTAFGPLGEKAVAVSSSYWIRWLNGDGSELRQLHRNVFGPRVSRRERRRAQAALRALANTHGLELSDIPLEVPRRKGPLRNLVFDADGRLWVERSVAHGSDNEADLYDRNGRWTRTVAWDSGIRLDLSSATGNKVLGVYASGANPGHVVLLRFESGK